MKEIKYHIDSVEVDDKVIIRGWAFGEGGKELDFSVNDQKVDVKRFKRHDVKSYFNGNEDALFSGFEIQLPFTNKVVLRIYGGLKEVQESIDTRKIKKLEKHAKWKDFLSKIKLSVVSSAVKYLFKNGFSKTWKKIKSKFSHQEPSTKSLYESTLYTEEELSKQKSIKFKKEPKISIIVPLYNTPLNFLSEMIDSVRNQTYSKWELCLADGSDEKHKNVKQRCLSYHDPRIVFQSLDDNYGISGNTNKALELAGGDFIALFDHDDVLHPAALYEVVKRINEEAADFIYTDEITFMDELSNVFNPHFKPDFAIDNLRANNYICHFTVFSSDLYRQVGGFRSEFDGSQDFDMVLRLTERANHITHIPKVLYYWRAHKNSVAAGVGAKPYVIEAAHKAIASHLKRCGLKGKVEDTMVPSMYKITYEIINNPLISIIIPNKDHIEDLSKCIRSVLEKSTYKNYEIIIVENNSEESITFDYYEKIKSDKIKIVTYDGGFNYSAINNLGFQSTKGDYVILLNNDVEIITENWMEEMLMYCQREDVGAVGAKLYYPDDTVQHAGLGLGLLTLAGHYHRSFPREHPGYMGRLIYAQDVTAVTAACLMVKRSVYEEVNGLDETFEVAFNDVDFCMKIREKEYLIVFTPFAELYHYESKSRGSDSEPAKRERFLGEVSRFQKKWKKELKKGDPYYNPNLTLDREDFGVR